MFSSIIPYFIPKNKAQGLYWLWHFQYQSFLSAAKQQKKKKSFERLPLLLFKKSTITFNKSDFAVLRCIGCVIAWKTFKWDHWCISCRNEPLLGVQIISEGKGCQWVLPSPSHPSDVGAGPESVSLTLLDCRLNHGDIECPRLEWGPIRIIESSSWQELRTRPVVARQHPHCVLSTDRTTTETDGTEHWGYNCN